MKIVKNSIILYILLCLVINIFFVNLANTTFSDLKVNTFITSFRFHEQIFFKKLKNHESQ